ncbi:C-type single domain activation associated secreted protein ASP3 [Trichostrongylus colubriformis]|uniref:C-type single domain activation associated secreted protein ASP3 n=1 Tax=Trichostrongylus colubriformis TaxID=6319 RepID=A0AAN8IWQ1_TRICO
MVILAPIVAYLTLLHTPGWAGMCSDKDGMSDEVRQAFVDKHNEYRSLVAKGKAVNGIGGFAPKAARMFKMKYDCDVEKKRHGWGENLWAISVPDYNKTKSAISATYAWFKELERYGVPAKNVLTMDVFNRGVGHYTQVVWQQSDRIGCAVKTCSKTTYAGCQYKDAGNVLNNPIYDIGNPCRKDTDCQYEILTSVLGDKVFEIFEFNSVFSSLKNAKNDKAASAEWVQVTY